MDKIKEAVTPAAILAYFDPAKPTEESGDASSRGIGFVLSQEDHPVRYASSALTQTKQRYSQIDKELLAQVLSLLSYLAVKVILSFCHSDPPRLALLPTAPGNCTCKFIQTPNEVEVRRPESSPLYGAQALGFHLEKTASFGSKRLQRLLLRLQQYDVEIRYRPGREMYLGDTLSRAYQSPGPDDSQRSEIERKLKVSTL